MKTIKSFCSRSVLYRLLSVSIFLCAIACESYDDPLDEDWDDEVLDELAGTTKSGCEGKCSSSCQCGWTEEGCDRDSDCRSGLYCKIRPQQSNRCLKKKTNNDNGDNNESCHTFKPGHGSYCSSSCQCKEGEGDCDKDSECKSGLVCKQQSGTDFCVKPAGNDCVKGQCSSDCPCAEGKGDCDKDSDCQSGLVCKQQSGTDFCVSADGGGGDDGGGDGGGGNDTGNGSGDLKIVIFSVGSADSTLIVFPTGKTMLVDSATDKRCQRDVLPFLNRHGIKHLDYYLETHPHGDHSGGAPILKNSGHIDSRTRKWDWKTYDYKDQFQLEKTKWFISNAHDTSFNGSDANDNSVAFRMEYNGFVYSAGGDQSTDSQNRFLKDHPSLVQAHVRNTAHHMWGPVSKSFLVKTNPFIFVTSCHSRGSLPSSFRSAVSTLEKNGRLRDSVITGDADVGHVAIRASSKSSWDYKFCGKQSACVVDYLR